jgi:hypothetical protein
MNASAPHPWDLFVSSLRFALFPHQDAVKLLITVSFRLLRARARKLYAVSRNRPKGAVKSMKYHIRVKGHLSSAWQAWFEGVEIVQEEDGTSRLSGFLRDQAALYGILLRIRDLGLTLLSLESCEVP